ncbi:MAG: hypothetical protein AB2693_31160 [Candidatus Thiodiazotropha sp.]
MDGRRNFTSFLTVFHQYQNDLEGVGENNSYVQHSIRLGLGLENEKK